MRLNRPTRSAIARKPRIGGGLGEDEFIDAAIVSNTAHKNLFLACQHEDQTTEKGLWD